MKKLLTLFAIALAVVVSSCSKFDDTQIWDKLDDHESRISNLEELCREMNSNIGALQTIVTALQTNDYITSVTPVTKDGKTIGYTITFTKSNPITIYHGENGKDGTEGKDGLDGYTPVIGVKKDESGFYYWTVDGEWLLDENGNKIKAVGVDGKDGIDGANGQDGVDGKDGVDGANGQDGADGKDGVDGADGQDGADGKDGIDGITPELKIENDYWYVSYDNGLTWIQLGKATGEDGQDGEDGVDGSNGTDGKNGVDGDSFFSNIDTSNNDYVVFTLADGTEIKIPTWYAFEQLQILCNQMNANIAALQTIVNAIQNNDYVQSITPLVDGGKEIGYTITFTKSGTIIIYHGIDGEDGSNGTDGSNGIDGHTPIIGVSKDADGIYYWTVDGEWLLDENGNKIKAVGTDGEDGANGMNGADGQDGVDGSNGQDGTDGVNGKDGITPELKIENGYWYVSYNNGSIWTQLGRATGENGQDGKDGVDGANGQDGANGKDGVDGDSFFSGVDISDVNYVVFTLVDGTEIKIPTWYAFEQLQILCNQLNANITALQQIVEALQNNDFIESITPLIQNGIEIGYTITFTKSGSVVVYHGTDGEDGINGTDGKDGIDGNTPIIGVKQDKNGEYYWTINGAWLLDENSDKIKAIGTDGEDGANGQDGADGKDGQDGANGVDGKDGITPELKIENGYWYVSYDNGLTWVQLGKATGENGQDGKDGADGANGQDGANGKDGVDGDSFFQNVTQDENNAYLTLADGTVITIPKATSYLFNRLQSVTYIPKYADGVAVVDNNILELDYQISPKNTVVDIAANWEDYISVKSIYTITRAVSYTDLNILSCEADSVNGIISLTVSCENLNEEFFIGNQAASVVLMLSDGNNNITSEYTPIEPYHPYNEIWYTSNNGEVITPNKANVFGANIVSNTLINGKGVIKFDGAVTEIGDSAFYNKSGLMSIVLPSTVTSIGSNAFDSCSYTHIVIPESVSSFGTTPFDGCAGTITIKCNIPSSDKALFPSVTDVIIGEGVTTIGDRAFYGNSNIKSVSLPESLTSIGVEAFVKCAKLTNVTIPNNVTAIGDSAFYECTSLSNITIPDGLIVINKSCFGRCSSITDIVIGQGVTSIGQSAFYGCTALNSINIPDNVTTIENYAFDECTSLTYVTLGSGITSIGVDVFTCNNAKIYCMTTTPPAICVKKDAYNSAYGSFGYPGSRQIYVPSESYSLYTQYISYRSDTTQQSNWALYKDKIIAYDFENDVIVE